MEFFIKNISRLFIAAVAKGQDQVLKKPQNKTYIKYIYTYKQQYICVKQFFSSLSYSLCGSSDLSDPLEWSLPLLVWKPMIQHSWIVFIFGNHTLMDTMIYSESLLFIIIILHEWNDKLHILCFCLFLFFPSLRKRRPACKNTWYKYLTDPSSKEQLFCFSFIQWKQF